MNELETQLLNLLAEVSSYKETPTKARSKRIRLQLGTLKNNTPILRAELMALDAKGY